MLTRRIIPCLDIRDGRVVKGIKFQGLRDAGDPAERACNYQEQGADEIVFLDVSATPEGRATALETVRTVREQLSIPLTVGGGVVRWENAQALLEAGADKVAANTAAVKDPKLITQIAERFGSQCMVLSLDAKMTGKGKWNLVVRSGTKVLDIDAVQWAKKAVDLGAGEILLTSWDRDGTRSGYDLALLEAVSKEVPVPLIASGGADNPQQLLEGLQAGADAVLAASIFHDGDYTVSQIKEFLASKNVEVRL